MSDEDCKKLKDFFKKKKLSPILVSAATKKNVDSLLKELFKFLDKNPKEEEKVIHTFYDPHAIDHKLDKFLVFKDKKIFYVEGKKIEGLVSVTDLRDFQSVAHLMRVLKSIGIFTELEAKGAKEGDTVYIAGIEFEYSPETMVVT